MTRSSQGLTDTIVNLARQKPEALLLMIAGGALLMRNGSMFGFGSTETSAETNMPHSRMATHVSDAADRMGQAGGGLRETAQGYVAQASEAASNYVDTAQEYGQRFTETVTRKASDLSDQARGQMNSGIETISDQPVLLIGLGIVTGMAVASVLPRSRFEDEALEGVRERLADVTDMASDRAKSALRQASEKLKEEADTRGFTPEKLKEAASEVASSVASSVTEAGNDKAPGAKVGTGPETKSS
jgi:hypothetical protein